MINRRQYGLTAVYVGLDGDMMTGQDLKNLYWLGKEIDMLQERIDTMTARAENITSRLKAVTVQSSHDNRQTEDASIELAELKEILEGQLAELIKQERQITEWLETIPDSLTRQILTYRYIDRLPWWKVADRIGGGNTDESVRKIASRYIVSHCG